MTKEGDFGFRNGFVITNRDGSIMNLTQATNAILRTKIDGELTEITCDITDPANGVISYVVPPNLFSSQGLQEVEVEIWFGEYEKITTDTASYVIRPRV